MNTEESIVNKDKFVIFSITYDHLNKKLLSIKMDMLIAFDNIKTDSMQLKAPFLAGERIKTFSKMKDNILTTMNLTKQRGSVELNINILFCQRSQEYELSVTEQFVISHDQLKKCFQKPEDVFDELVQNFEEIKIDHNGGIQFEVMIGKKRTVIVRLQAIKKQKQVNGQASLELVKLTKEFAEYKKKTNTEIQNLTAKVNKFELLNIEQNHKISQLWEMVGNISNRVDKEVAELRQDIENLYNDDEDDEDDDEDDEENKDEEGNVQKEKQEENTLISELNSVKKEIVVEKYFSGTFFYSVTPHPNHSFNNNFCLQKGKVLVKVAQNNKWQNYIFKGQLRKNMVNNFKIDVVQSKEMCINVGVISEQLFNKTNTRAFHENTFFNLKTGQIWKNGTVANNTGSPLQVGSTLRMSINLKAKNMQLFKRGQGKEDFIASEPLPNVLLNKKLFFFICMRGYGDGVRLTL